VQRQWLWSYFTPPAQFAPDPRADPDVGRWGLIQQVCRDNCY